MLELLLQGGGRRALRVLCVGAHCDDIEIGCGATLLALQRRGAVRSVDWAVLSGPAERHRETQAAMRRIVRAAHRGSLVCGDFPDGRFPADYAGIKDFVESLKASAAPDVIFCHERDDRHQDHRIVNEMVWNTFRDHLILEYEIAKWDGGLAQPNVYVPVSESQAEAKATAVLESHRSQAGRHWFTRDGLLALMRLRGIECRSPSGLAEAFHGRKLQIR